MKARFSSLLALSLALSILPFVGACTEDGTQGSLVSSANAQTTAVAAANDLPAPPAPAEPAPSEAAPDIVATVVEPAPATERKLPPTIRTNSPALDVIKMAQAGVDETVMLTFITNTSSMFVLTSDEIVYLNDIGVPPTVVTAMIQRDQEIKQFWSNASQPVTPPATEVQAAAPTYVEPPQPESQPTVEAAPAQPTVVNHNYFYDTLSPYGTWVEIEGYGRCWQPTVVVANRHWRPYSDGGRWIYTDAGWYWLSDYSWGATTFHYGRWFNHARWGWCWWPDTVWAPSWVSFRYSSDYCGWAPLPPYAYYRSGLGFSYYGRSVGLSFGFGLSAGHYTFVSWNRFCDPRPWHHRVRPHEVTRIYNNTTIINNYVTGDNNTVINRGVGRDRVRDLARTEVKTVNLRDMGPSRSASGRQERLERDGRTLAVHRPKFSAEERSSFTGTTSGRPAATRPTSTANIAPAASTKEIAVRPDRRERSEAGRTSPSVGQSDVKPAPATPVTAAPRTESRPIRNREMPVGRTEHPNVATTTPIGSARPAARPAPSAPAAPQSPAPVAQPKTESPARPARPQQNPVIVVGKPQDGAPTVNRAYPVFNSPQNPSRPVQPVQPQVTPVGRPQSPQVNPSPRTTPTPSRQENAPPTRNFSPPTRSERPSASAPTVSRPSPSFSPRVSQPAPVPRSYSPPPVSTPRPAPSVSAPTFTPRPAPSAPSPSFSPRPAPAPAPSAPRSAPAESRPSPGNSRSENNNGRPGR